VKEKHDFDGDAASYSVRYCSEHRYFIFSNFWKALLNGNYQVKEQHDLDGDAKGSVADAQDDVGGNVAAVSKVAGHGDRHVDQEQN
jgi:hypothetical protein